MKLTVSMATYDDYDGVFFTIQSIRMHQKLPDDTEFLVLDNNPTSAHGEALRNFISWIPNGKLVPITNRKSSFIKYDALKLATGDVVLGLDCHVLLVDGFIESMMDWWGANQGTSNQLTGPLTYTCLKAVSTHIDPQWRGHDYGIWANDDRHYLGEPYEIPAQGMGCFSFWRESAPTVHSGFTGFGGEEWYMAEKTRKAGGKVICHPKLGWMHRFSWPKRTFPLQIGDKIFNYYLGWLDLYRDHKHPKILEMDEVWSKVIPLNQLRDIKLRAAREIAKS